MLVLMVTGILIGGFTNDAILPCLLVAKEIGDSSSMSKATVLFELQPTSIRHRPGSHPDAPPKRVERVALPPILL
ncbi:hypothetical protein, partial [Phormidesmis priestleyi]